VFQHDVCMTECDVLVGVWHSRLSIEATTCSVFYGRTCSVRPLPQVCLRIMSPSSVVMCFDEFSVCARPFLQLHGSWAAPWRSPVSIPQRPGLLGMDLRHTSLTTRAGIVPVNALCGHLYCSVASGRYHRHCVASVGHGVTMDADKSGPVCLVL